MRRPARTFGVVRYLNAKPLTVELERRPELTLIQDVPARLVERFQAGELDVALLPVMAYLSGVGHSIIPGLGISSWGTVESVRLFVRRRELGKTPRILLDAESVTSNALCRCFLHQGLGLAPEFFTRPEDVPDPDAELRIGDQGMRPDATAIEIWDMGDVWTAWTGLPFLYAAWVVREGVDDPGLATLLTGALEGGLARIPEIAVDGARATGLSREACERYLRERIRYRLGDEEERGLRRFATEVRREGLVPEEREIRYYAE